jgi:hypothetical protein
MVLCPAVLFYGLHSFGFFRILCPNRYSGILVPLFEDVRLDNNGNPSDGSTVGWTWSESTLTDKKVNGKYKIDDYFLSHLLNRTHYQPTKIRIILHL